MHLLLVLPSRSDHLYVFFMQWSPDMYGEGARGMEQEPGFMVVKKNEASESAEDEPITDINVKEWEVGSPVSSSCYSSAVLSHLSWIKYSPHYGLIHYCISNMLPLICENTYSCGHHNCVVVKPCFVLYFVHFHALLHILYLLMLLHFRVQFTCNII